ncbi:hypothetical protein ACYFX5_26865 [Bremerella sp. T1]|uniref:hypothetical protein n=1 Tax=Bremerella sp. TYQ1 TaxID=3119568 RepID=UPI001CCA3D99|nr:hypothetical protein [Bremerella volcania]UBM36632.1 hypothetical protein LA756_01720 [Bremerella volcania]
MIDVLVIDSTPGRREAIMNIFFIKCGVACRGFDGIHFFVKTEDDGRGWRSRKPLPDDMSCDLLLLHGGDYGFQEHIQCKTLVCYSGKGERGDSRVPASELYLYRDLGANGNRFAVQWRDALLEYHEQKAAGNSSTLPSILSPPALPLQYLCILSYLCQGYLASAAKTLETPFAWYEAGISEVLLKMQWVEEHVSTTGQNTLALRPEAEDAMLPSLDEIPHPDYWLGFFEIPANPSPEVRMTLLKQRLSAEWGDVEPDAWAKVEQLLDKVIDGPPLVSQVVDAYDAIGLRLESDE